ncbi:MAG: hypothetical protein E6Q75_01100 [Rheinheimera sp.]|nr:MAG: hypothetical protein E6Q75_01100 [Rheinheimera sp.]
MLAKKARRMAGIKSAHYSDILGFLLCRSAADLSAQQSFISQTAVAARYQALTVPGRYRLLNQYRWQVLIEDLPQRKDGLHGVFICLGIKIIKPAVAGFIVL